MTYTKHIYITLTVVLLTAIGINAQTYVNKEWVNNFGAPDTIDWSAKTTCLWGRIITVGNTMVQGQQANILITVFSDDGTIEWQTDWNGPQNGSDYGAAVISDYNGNIYVAGASQYNPSTDFDIVLLKYDWQGNLQWEIDYDGTGGTDVPVEIAMDNAGYIYITGTSKGSSSNFDFITLKFDENGNLEWDARYDFNGNIDIAVNIVVEETGDQVTVTGGSEYSLGNWDYTTVSYNINGNQTNVNREPSDETDIRKPKDIVKDAGKNFYITGIQDNGTNNDIKLIKLDSTLQSKWVQVYDEENEGSNALAIDKNGNLYIGGWQEKAPGFRKFLLLKYDSFGNLLWSQTLWPTDDKTFAEITDITLDLDDVVSVIGFASDGSNSDIVTAQYNPDGNLAWVKTWGNMIGSIDFPTNIQQTGDNIFVSGRTNDTSGTKWVTIKYSYSTRPSDIISDTISNIYYKNNQLLIWFNPEVVDKNFIDNRELEFSLLHEVIHDSIRFEMFTKSGVDFWETPLKVFKLMTHMTSADSISISRLGDTVKMKPFWSVFIVETPEGNDLEDAADSLLSLTDHILYAGTAKIAFLHDIPDDPLFLIEQESLFPNPNNPLFPNAHINVEPAWDIEQGQNYINVGVFDFTIFWAHPDFGDGTYGGSKIKGGWNWPTNSHISALPHPLKSHGTAVAGIIGALRNNNEGIAGIAGGDVQNNNTGVKLYSFGIADVINHPNGPYSYIDIPAAISGIIQGSASWNPNTGFGYGLHIQNHSWGAAQYDLLLEEALETCWRNQCVFVASRGNEGNAILNYPACYRDELVINVGASGTDGEHFDGTNIGNGDGFLPQNKKWKSSFGGNIDVIAPGVTDIVAAPHDPTVPYNWNAIFSTGSCTVQDINNNYTCFHGTSAAAPNVSGLVALMLSHHHPNNNFDNGLAPEDVERLVQKNANDIAGGNQSYPTGYDQWNGWGRINAFSTMQDIEFPQFSIFHNNAPSNTSQTTVANQQIIITENINGISAGNYIADRIQITATYLDVFSSTTQILDQWGQPSSSNGYSAANPVSDDTWANYNFTINNNIAAVTTTTFCWFVKTNTIGQTINKWIPDPPMNLHTNYSLHLFDPNATSVDEIEESADITIYPVPADNQIKVECNLLTSEDITILIYDVQGRVILSRNLGKVSSVNESFHVQELQSSIYFLMIKGDKTNLVKKFIKQ